MTNRTLTKFKVKSFGIWIIASVIYEAMRYYSPSESISM